MGCVLLTGIAGFIGSHLGESLVRDGWPVRGVDAFTDTYALGQKRDNLAALSRSPMVQLVTADLARDDLHGLLEGVEAVVHLAGEPGVPGSWGRAFPTYVERNVIATQRLLEAAATAGVRRFVYASSSSVYGPDHRPLVESMVPRPLSPYGASKLAGEVLVGAYAQERGLSTVALRYFSVFGPRQRPDMAPHRFIECLLDRRPLPVYGDGRQARDFTFVADVVAATTAALTTALPTATVLNVARGESVEVNELIAILAEELGVEPVIEHRPSRVGDAPRTEGCADAARTLLHWVPATDLRVGLRRQVEWHLERRLESEPPAPAAVADALSFAGDPTPTPGAPGLPGSLEPVAVGGEQWRSLQ